jgi:hypothetical protein
MTLSQAQIARNHLAAATLKKRPAREIEQARADLEYAKAAQAVASWSHLPQMQRNRLAAKLIAGNDDAMR